MVCVLIPTNTQLDKGGYHLWVLNSSVLFADKKHGRLYYFIFHSAFFLKKLPLM